MNLKLILSSIILLLASSTVYAETEPVEDELEVLVLSTMDIRRSPTTAPLLHRSNEAGDDLTKHVKFTFYTGDLFKYNPNAHGYLMTDGYIKQGEPLKSLQGRGITIGHTNHCVGIGMEQFGINSGFKDVCIPIKWEHNSFYDIKVVTVTEGLKVEVVGPGIDDDLVHRFEGNYPSYDTVFGVAGDREPSTYGFFNMIQMVK